MYFEKKNIETVFFTIWVWSKGQETQLCYLQKGKQIFIEKNKKSKQWNKYSYVNCLLIINITAFITFLIPPPPHWYCCLGNHCFIYLILCKHND